MDFSSMMGGGGGGMGSLGGMMGGGGPELPYARAYGDAGQTSLGGSDSSIGIMIADLIRKRKENEARNREAGTQAAATQVEPQQPTTPGTMDNLQDDPQKFERLNQMLA